MDQFIDHQSEYLVKSLQKLMNFDAISGREVNIGRFIMAELQKLSIDVETDSLGNIIAKRQAIQDTSGKTLMICAHLDEIGYIVRRIEPNGFIRFHKVGTPNINLLPGRLMRVEGITGVIGVKSWHQSTIEERKKLVPIEELYLDIGASSADEVRKMGINIGSPITYISDLVRIGNSTRYVGKAVDDRIGCLLLMELLKSLPPTLAWNIVGVFSVQEEVGLRGATTATYAVKPDIAISIDNTFAEDTPEYPAITPETVVLGKGPVIHIMEFTDEFFKGVISHPTIVHRLEEIAHRYEINYQVGFHIQGMTDATAIHLSRGGIPTCSLGIPSRYTHSPVEMFDLADVVALLTLLMKFIETIDGWNISKMF